MNCKLCGKTIIANETGICLKCESTPVGKNLASEIRRKTQSTNVQPIMLVYIIVLIAIIAFVLFCISRLLG